MLMKTCTSDEQKRCRIAGGEESFVLGFLFLEPVLSFCRRVSRQKQNIQFFNHLICGFISKTALRYFNIALLINFIIK